MSLLQIQNMTKTFGGLCAVSDFSIAIEGNELMALIGPNGAGKTTVFNLVSGFYSPTEGSLVFKGKSLAGLKPHQVTAMGIARTFQNIRLWHDMTVLENIQISQHYNLGYNLVDAFLRTRRYMGNEKRIADRGYEILEALDLRQFAEESPRTSPTACKDASK